MRIRLLWILIGTAFCGHAQREDGVEMEQLLQNWVQQPGLEGMPREEVYETIYQYYREPLNLNTCEAEDLEALFVLTDIQIRSLLEYRQRFGELLSIYELQAVPHWDLETIRRVSPLLAVVSPAERFPALLRRVLKNDQQYVLSRHQWATQDGQWIWKDSTQLGMRPQLYMRYRNSRPGDYSIGLTLEKDGGEPLRWQPANAWYGLDYVSFHAAVFRKGRWKAICLGDFQVQAGQGLVMSSGFYLGKGAEPVLTLRRSNLGIRPYSSSIESGFFRGVAGTYVLGRTELTVFASRQTKDARESTDSLESFVSSLYETAPLGKWLCVIS